MILTYYKLKTQILYQISNINNHSLKFSKRKKLTGRTMNIEKRKFSYFHRLLGFSLFGFFMMMETSLFIKNVYSDHSSLFINSGNYLYEKGKFKQAIIEYDKAIKSHKKEFEAYLYRAMAKYNLNDHEGAIDDYSSVLKITRKNSIRQLAFYYRGLSKFAINDLRAALLDLNEALKLDEKDYEAFYARASLKVAMNNRNEAIEDFNTAINLNPVDTRIIYDRGLNYRKLDNEKLACKDFIQANSLGESEKSAQWITGRDSQYCMPYLPSDKKIPDKLSDKMSKWDVDDFLKFEVVNHCLEKKQELTSDQAEFRRRAYKNHAIYSFKRISNLDFNYLMNSEDSKNKLQLMINKDGGCNEIVADLRNRYNGSLFWNDRTKKEFKNITWDQAKNNALTLPMVDFYSDATYHPIYSISETKKIIQNARQVSPKEWGKKIKPKKNIKGIKSDRKFVRNRYELCNAEKWTGYPTRKRSLNCLEVYQGKKNLRLVQLKSFIEQINPKRDPIPQFTRLELVECDQNRELSMTIRIDNKKWDSHNELWSKIKNNGFDYLSNVCSNF